MFGVSTFWCDADMGAQPMSQFGPWLIDTIGGKRVFAVLCRNDSLRTASYAAHSGRHT